MQFVIDLESLASGHSGLLRDAGYIGPYAIAGKRGFQAPEIEAATGRGAPKLDMKDLFKLCSREADIGALGKVLVAIAYAPTDRLVNKSNHHDWKEGRQVVNEEVLERIPPKVRMCKRMLVAHACAFLKDSSNLLLFITADCRRVAVLGASVPNTYLQPLLSGAAPATGLTR